MAQTDKATGFRPAVQAELIPQHDGQVSTIGRGGSSNDAEMMRVSVETARRYPRNEDEIIARLMKMIDLYPEFADKAIYQIEYKDTRSASGKTIVSGMSIRAAETIAAEWGHMWVAARIAGETEDYIDVEVLCIDTQRNNREMLPYRISKFRKGRDSQQFTLLNDREQLMMLQAGISKARRNAIMATLPLHVKEVFRAAVYQAIAGGPLAAKADADRVAKCLAAFDEEFKVTQEQLERYVGKPRVTWTGGNLAKLRTLYTAIETGEITLEEAFKDQDATPAAPPPTGTVESATDGNLGTAAPAKAGREEPAPKPDPKPAPKPAPPAAPAPQPAAPAAPPKTESKAERLRRELAEEEAAEHAARDAAPEAAAKTAVKAPPLVQPVDKPVAPAAAPGGKLAELAVKIDACQSPEELEALVGKMYTPGGEFETMERAEKRVVMAKIGEKRDKLVAEAAAKPV